MAMWNATNVLTNMPPIYSVNSSTPILTYFLACSLGVNMALGLPANCYILWLSVNEIMRGQSTEIFIFNTALIEVIFSFCCVLVIKQYFYDCTSCKFGVTFLGLVLLVGRPLFQSCICVERYLGVVHPLIFLKLKPMKYRIACSAVGWILITSKSLIVSIGVIGLYDFLLTEFLIYFSVKLYSCLMVLKVLVRPGPSDNIKQKEGVNQDKSKAFQIILMVLLSAVLMYGPPTVSLVLYHIIDFERFFMSWSTSMCLGLMAGFVQPFLYLKRPGKLSFCSKV